VTSSPSSAAREALSTIADPEVRLLTTRFARYLADEDLAYRPVDFLARHATELAEYARMRPADTALVRVADLDHAPATDCVLQIVTDDMPFLVDSVTNAVGVVDVDRDGARLRRRRRREPRPADRRCPA
jgi:glutamate dehydrogenase